MNILITILIAPIILIIGNWISLLPYSLLISFTQNSNIQKYLSRIAMGGTVGLLFGLIEQWNANNIILWIIFAIFLIFLSEPERNKISTKLMLTRGISFFLTKNLVWFLFLII
tara:strand:- start:190 stop:528 length:339 start_codon:yes stop_codon:yes gene_type:complete